MDVHALSVKPHSFGNVLTSEHYKCFYAFRLSNKLSRKYSSVGRDRHGAQEDQSQDHQVFSLC